MRVLSRVRIFCLGMVAVALSACAQSPGSKPFFFQDGYSESSARARASNNTGGDAVIVNKGDTLYSIARRTGTSVKHLASANRLRRPYTLEVGQRLVVPARQTAMAAPPPPAAQKIHVVRRDETLYRISVNNGTSVATLASLNGIRPPYDLAVGQQIRLPGQRGTSTATGAIAPPPGHLRSKPPETKSVRRQETRQAALSEPPRTRRSTLRAPPRTTNSRFIWPVEGRVISRFGGKATGLRNDGINIKTDEGAPVRAANSGIVTYAGNELRGYGNLLLLKHSDGYITAYAHNSELLVEKGARVNKGQVIASVGRTGNVNEPQLHFEIRRGSKAIDPEKYLGK